MQLGRTFFAGALLTLAGALLFALPTHARTANVFIDDDEIDVNDGVLTDWPEESLVVDESGVSDVEYNTWCWDAESETWDSTINTVEDCENSYFYNGDASMDIQTGYFGINETNMLMGIEANFAMQAVYDTTNEEYVEFYQLLDDVEFNNGQEYGGIETLPEEYDHKMIFAFGPADEATYDYYIVANINFPQNFTEGEFEDVGLQVYEDSGETVGWQADEDTVIGELDPENSETTGGNGEDNEDRNLSEIFEVKLNIEDFFELSGLDFESYGFRYETHSYTDITDRVVVDLDDGEVEVAPAKVGKKKLKIRQVKRRRALLKWNAVTDAEYYKVRLDRKKVAGEKKWKKVKVFKRITAAKKQLKKKHLKAGKTYRYRVRACSSNNLCSAWGKYKKFTTLSVTE